ncbi:transmembrane protein 156 isoform X3 [Rousettus aegyptiacus]|uniref:transmembrane protein 156 isoform X3 n=1 Tax=Rousettus aegyptiacus TaxID=9407 RepID=UPI00168D1225|nr:transmembrane protein 156 isoform X3 [Rousettus aegyptiacus]
MTKTALLKLLLAIVITFILILPDYFKTPKGNVLELSCLEVCLQPNLTYPLSSNFSLMTFLQPVKETQTRMAIFLNHSSFQNFIRICQDITNEFKMCSLCLACEFKGNIELISQEQTSKVFIMQGSMEVMANDSHSPCQHFNFTVAPTADHLEGYNVTCNIKTHTTRSPIMEEDPAKENSINQTCRIMKYPHNCIHISLHLEMDVKNFFCSMKITWYVLVILVFIFLLILTIHKILEGHRQMQKWQSHKYKPSSVLLRGSDSEKLQTLNVRVISASRHPLALLKSQENDLNSSGVITHCRTFIRHLWGEDRKLPSEAAWLLLPKRPHRCLIRDHAEAALDSGQGSAFSNTRNRSFFHCASARSVYTNILLNNSSG